MYDIILTGKYKRNCTTICKKVQKYFLDKNFEEKGREEKNEEKKRKEKGREVREEELEKKIEKENEKIYQFNEEILGDVLCELKEDEIEISFTKLKEKITIFKSPVTISSELENINYTVYNQETLKRALDDQTKNYHFYCDDDLVTSDYILKQKPPLVKMIKKSEIPYEIFSPLNEKEHIPVDESVISIDTNTLIPIDISSLNLYRDENFSLIINERNRLITLLNEFLDSKYKIMKIFGVDGIGKSISFVYYTHLKNKYKVIYFNLKEIKLASNKDKFNLIIYQLLNYFSENLEESDKLTWEDQKQIAFKNFNDKLNDIKIRLNKSENCNFWEILINLLNNNLFKDMLLILDQYKSENDESNYLQQLENLVVLDESKKQIKILVSSSINDYGVKEDFILYLIAITELNSNKIIINDINDININNDSNIFKDDFSNDTFIKNFLGNNYDNRKEKLLSYINSNKNKERKNLIKNNLIQIVYINELVSVKDLENDSNKEQIEKLVDFNYNPKYYTQFKEIYKNNFLRINLNLSYTYFKKEKYKSISTKIKKFFGTYFQKIQNNSLLIINKIEQIQRLIKDKTQLSFLQLIWLLGEIPLKYFKILIASEKESDMENIKNKENMIVFNNDLLNTKFTFDYCFPFIKFVLERLIFDMEIINFNDISPSGIGAIVEKEIKKGIFTYKIFDNFIHRYVYSLNIIKSKNLKYLKPEIDIFNFQIGVLDDVVNHPLEGVQFSYYITPKNPNNEALDSAILIPSNIYDENYLIFALVCLQVTISKTLSKTLEEYHQFTLLAAKKFEKIYGIKIINKYFIFVLIKEYDNKATQNSLIKARIPFIFYSKELKQFLTPEDTPINNVSQLMFIDYKIIDKPLEEEIIAKKTGKLRKLENLLNRKRLLENKDTTEEDYYKERIKLFPKDEPINLPTQLIKKIIDYFKDNKFYSLKNVKSIRYAYVSPLYKVNSIIKENDLFGLIFYKKEMFIFYQGDISILSKENKKNIMAINEIENIIKRDIENKSDIKDEYGISYDQEKNYEKLTKYYLNNPSSIYVYQLQLN